MKDHPDKPWYLPSQPVAGRTHCITRKVPTEFRSLYVHVDINSQGRAVNVRISSPGKFDDTAIGDMLIALGQTISDVLDEARST